MWLFLTPPTKIPTSYHHHIHRCIMTIREEEHWEIFIIGHSVDYIYIYIYMLLSRAVHNLCILHEAYFSFSVMVTGREMEGNRDIPPLKWFLVYRFINTSLFSLSLSLFLWTTLGPMCHVTNHSISFSILFNIRLFIARAAILWNGIKIRVGEENGEGFWDTNHLLIKWDEKIWSFDSTE